MKEAQKKYKRKVKRLNVDFYLKDAGIYEFAKSINFTKFVKECLEREKTIRDNYKKGIY